MRLNKTKTWEQQLFAKSKLITIVSSRERTKRTVRIEKINWTGYDYIKFHFFFKKNFHNYYRIHFAMKRYVFDWANFTIFFFSFQVLLQRQTQQDGNKNQSIKIPLQSSSGSYANKRCHLYFCSQPQSPPQRFVSIFLWNEIWIASAWIMH